MPNSYLFDESIVVHQSLFRYRKYVMLLRFSYISRVSQSFFHLQ